MARVKGGIKTRGKHKAVLAMAKGYRMTRHKQIKKAKEALLHAGEYAFHGRKLKKREFRKLWIIRLNSSLRGMGMKYSQFIRGLKVNNIELDRKILSKLATEQPEIFKQIANKVKN